MADTARQTSEAFGDIEFEYNLKELLDKDPVAALGFDPAKAKFTAPQGYNNAHYLHRDKYTKDGKLLGKKDDVVYGPDFGASKDTIVHEFRHRGNRLLRQAYFKDPKAFTQKYGQDVVDFIVGEFDEAKGKMYLGDRDEEFRTELGDNLEATFNRPRPDTAKLAANLLGEESKRFSQKELEQMGTKFYLQNFDKFKGRMSDATELVTKEDQEKYKGILAKVRQAAFDLIKERKGYQEGGLTSSPRPQLRPGPTKTGRMTVRNRPVWQNPLTKEIYSEKTVTIPWGDGYATVPSVDGKGTELSREELYKRIVNVKTQLSKKGPVDFITGEDLPVFDTEEDAIKYAMWRSSTMFDKEASDQGFQLDQYELAPEKEDPSFLYDMGSYLKKIIGSSGALGLRKLGFDAYPTENSFAEGGMPSYRTAITPPAQYRNMLGDRTKKPLSVKGAEIGVEFTPAGTIFGLNDIKNELQKENPDYYKIGMMAGVEAIGLIPGLDKVAIEAIRAGAKRVGLDKVADQTEAVFGAPKPNPELEIFGGAKASNPPNMRDYGGIQSSFENEADIQTQMDLDIDFDDDPSGSMVRMMDEIERNPTPYQKTLQEIGLGKWFRGRDNLMRFEIDDSTSTATPQFATVHTRDELDDMFVGHDYEDDGFMSPYDPAYTDSQEKMFSTLSDVFSHRELFEKYPELADMPVVVDKTMDSDTLGYFDPRKGLIALSPELAKDANAARSTILHEIQHAIQRIEGFESGTGPLNMDVIEINIAGKNSPTIKNLEAKYEKELDDYLNSSIELKKDFISGAGQNLAELIKDFELRVLAEKSSTINKGTNGISYEDVKKKYDSSTGVKQLVKDLVAKDLPSEDKVFSSYSSEMLAAEALAAGRAPYGFTMSPDETFSHMPVPVSGGISYLDSINKSTNIKRSNEYADNYVKQLETVLARVADRANEEGRADLFKEVFKLDPESVVENFMDGSPEFFVEKTSGLQLPYKPDEPVITPLKLNEYDTNKVIYRAKRGEAEARNVQKRMDMSASERTPENVYSTEDVVPEEQWGDFELKRAKAGEDIFAEGKVFGLKGEPETKLDPEPEPKQSFIEALRKKFGFNQNSSEIANPSLQDFGYYVDNPSESWVKGKQEYAEKYAKEGGPSAKKLLSGSQTAFLGIDRDKPLYLDVDFVSQLKGANDEVIGPSNTKYIELKESVEKEGFKPDQKGNTILIGVNHKGQAFIMEGNNRVAVAKEYGVPSIKAEVKYFNGGEDAGGEFSPENILSYASTSPLDNQMQDLFAGSK